MNTYYWEILRSFFSSTCFSSKLKWTATVFEIAGSSTWIIQTFANVGQTLRAEAKCSTNAAEYSRIPNISHSKRMYSRTFRDSHIRIRMLKISAPNPKFFARFGLLVVTWNIILKNTCKTMRSTFGCFLGILHNKSIPNQHPKSTKYCS